MPINTDYRAGIMFELTMQDSELAHAVKVERALRLYYGGIPRDIEGAMEEVVWFYSCGAEMNEDETGRSSFASANKKKAFDYEQDANLIFSAFLEAYGLRLTTETTLHWWEFRALFEGLPTGCRISEIMGYRMANTKDMPKSMKKHYEKMKTAFALKNPRTVQSVMTLAERNQKMKEYVARRFEEVEKWRQTEA